MWSIDWWTSLQLASLCSKLTRESGTDFPIPVVPGAGDSETEKLIREKDEEVRHADHELESHDHTSERGPDRHKHSGAQAEPETHSDHLADEALWVCSAHRVWLNI